MEALDDSDECAENDAEGAVQGIDSVHSPVDCASNFLLVHPSLAQIESMPSDSDEDKHSSSDQSSLENPLSSRSSVKTFLNRK